MPVKSPLFFILVLVSTCLTLSVYGEESIMLQHDFSIKSEKETVTAITSDPGPIEELEKKFDFDWNQHETIASNKTKINDIETFLSSIHDVSKLIPEEQLALGRLFYKLGTYYTHVSREPDLAIARLTIASALLTQSEEKAWNDNHLAYAYEQKYASSLSSSNRKKTFYYINKVISKTTPQPRDKIHAFAYSIKGLVHNDAKQYALAITNFKLALAIHAAIPNSLDEHYVRTKNRLANALIGKEGHDKEAIAMLKQVERYWLAKGDLKAHPFGARNLLSLGQAYLKIGKPKAALREVKSAIDIYKSFYGANSVLLVKPYQLLAQAYKKIGNFNQASAYEQKAISINSA